MANTQDNRLYRNIIPLYVFIIYGVVAALYCVWLQAVAVTIIADCIGLYLAIGAVAFFEVRLTVNDERYIVPRYGWQHRELLFAALVRLCESSGCELNVATRRSLYVGAGRGHKEGITL